MATDSRKLAKNVIFVYSRVICVTIIGLLSTRYALQVLGQSDYGLYGVVGGIVAVLAIVNTAMSTTTRRFINIEAGKKDGNVNKVFNTCLAINAILGVGLFILAETIGLFYVYNYLNVDPTKLTTAIIVFNISTATSAFAIVFTPFLSLLESHENFGKIAIVDVGISAVKLLLICSLFLVSAHRLIWYSIIMSMMIFGRLLMYTFFCRRYWPETVKVKLYKDKTLYKDIAVFNNYIALGATAYVARNQGSNMIVNYFFGTIVNGAMSIAYAIESYIMIIISNLTTASAPQITKSYSAGEIEDAVELSARINRYSVMFMSTVVFLVYVELPTYLTIWLGEIPVGALALCQCTLISALVRSLSEGLPPLIQATGKIKWFQITTGIMQCIVLPIGWLLFHYGFPPQSIIICFICTTLANFGFTLLLAINVIGKKNVGQFVRASLISNGIIISVYAAYVIAQATYDSSINPVVNISIAILISIIMVLYIGLNKSERESVLSKIVRRK